ncbi:FxSxx-COOH cyclophane-containing RiPP peptide [Streptomyces sp. NPDC059913]|uniref:FxSxx-COOH cyclophane-containing RiPP peptide n=1 Tax=unclassified Streptomyces TaxID=2593676 RepID=UPI0036468C17
MNTSESSVSFAAAKKNRVPLAQIDVHGTAADRKLGRVHAASAARRTQAATFNSAL